MIACTWPFGTCRLIPLRISLSSSANFTRRFLISSMLTPSPRRGALQGPRRSPLLRPRAQLDLGWVEYPHPIAFPFRGLAILHELDQERLAGAESFDHGAHVTGPQNQSRTCLRQRVAPFTLPLVQLPVQLRRR